MIQFQNGVYIIRLFFKIKEYMLKVISIPHPQSLQKLSFIARIFHLMVKDLKGKGQCSSN